jgi:outer membrane protein TolC
MKRFIFAVMAICILAGIIWSEEQPALTLSLDNAIEQALKNNLDLQIAVTSPAIAQAAYNQSRAIFIPTFTLNSAKSKSTSPSYNSVVTGTEISTSKAFETSAGISQLLPIGGQLQVSLDATHVKSNSLLNRFNPYNNAQLTFSLSQPLLKGFGTFATRRAIILAGNNLKTSHFTLKQSIINLIYSVEEAYWNLVYAEQNLEVSRKSLDLARDLLKQNETQVRVGVSAPMDVLAAKAEVATRESSLLSVENAVKTAAENLRVILNAPDENLLKPADKQPVFEPRQADFNAFLQLALENRPDIQQAKLDLKSKNVEVRYARNQLLPDLQLTARYSAAGLSGNQTLENGTVIESGMGDALRDVFKNLYNSNSVALQLSVPVLNSDARAGLTQAQLSLKQSLLQLKKAESTTYSEVKQATSDLEVNYKLVEANRIARELAEQKLAAEQKKLAVGLSTNYQVLQYQRDYANALNAELKSLIDYKLTLSRVDRVLGRTLETHSIEFDAYLPK